MGLGKGVTYRGRVLTPIRVRPLMAGAVVTAALAILLAGCSSSGGTGSKSSSASSAGNAAAASSSAAASSTSAKPTPTKPPTKPVHIMLLNADGSTFGVGMPEIAYFTHKITDARALQKATKVTVNGQPEQGAWYFEYSAAHAGYPVEGHFRLQNYWPAHAKIHIEIPAKGLSAGSGYSFNDSLTSDWNTGPRNVSTVDDSTHRMTVTSDGHTYGTFPVSLGASNTPTARGIKVIMEKGASICMRGPGYYECGVKYTQRLTYGGEYLHSAPWNISHINGGVDSSNGCTNLLPSDAQRLYGFLNIGDVVIYPNANGPAMSLGSGYGDWNVDWSTWKTGGLAPTV